MPLEKIEGHSFLYSFVCSRVKITDVLILGSGSAGTFFALQLAERSDLHITIVTKKERSESNTNYAQGGIASVMNEHDSFESHIRDTLVAGAGLCNEEAVKTLVYEGPERIRDLIEIGARFTRSRTGDLDLGKEGGHSIHRIVHAKDLTGKEVERSLLAAIAKKKNITLLEDHYAVELLTDHSRIDKQTGGDDSISCYGAYVLAEASGTVEILYARKAVMLATGGCGHIYLHTTNPSIATGDGVAMAYRAGASIANMEFIQFHPTALFNNSEGKAFLISEAVRGAGGILRNKKGERFMKHYDKQRMELEPRDIVARAIDSELKKHGDDFVLLDLSHLPAKKIKDEFPNIYAHCKKTGLDITKKPIPVVPAAHFGCGGVMTNLNGRTNINRLYACGEVSMTGVHGANRLASNSLLASLVFSKRAADDLLASLRTEKRTENVKLKEWDDSGTENAEEWVVIEHDKREVQQLMWDYVGIVRSTYRLERAKRRVDLIVREIEQYYRKTKVTVPLLELRNMAMTAQLVIRSALARKESRGLHYTTDYPKANPKLAKKNTVL
ncbi:MAG TPA: L-aspartate oxidase [Steroidobacteraceae bacterium]|nr:L-aspartate oxidase [Steroidobacteraceae bacterium]